MRRQHKLSIYRYWFIILLLIMGTGAFDAIPYSALQGQNRSSSRLAGVVLEKESQKPMPGVAVVLSQINTNHKQYTKTDVNGNFSFPVFPSAQYSVFPVLKEQVGAKKEVNVLQSPFVSLYLDSPDKKHNNSETASATITLPNDEPIEPSIIPVMTSVEYADETTINKKDLGNAAVKLHPLYKSLPKIQPQDSVAYSVFLGTFTIKIAESSDFVRVIGKKDLLVKESEQGQFIYTAGRFEALKMPASINFNCYIKDTNMPALSLLSMNSYYKEKQKKFTNISKNNGF